ncbi:MAG: chalcone isomerase family protein [Gammaproteobacteria bacterium]|nr:chalcone isomerase family protein [Gammaproteobacteria bacterium]
MSPCRLGTFLALLVASATMAGGAPLPERWTHAGQALERKASAPVHYAGIFHVYDAALYGPAGVASRALAEVRNPACLVIEYRMTVSAERLREAADKVLSRQQADLAPLAARIARLHAAYRDVAEGDRFALCHAPGLGTTLDLNGVRQVTVEGDDFARAYFGIWLGEEPIAPPLREAVRDGEDRLDRA